MKVKVAAVQMKMTDKEEENIRLADLLVKDAANKGANIILLPELFSSLYFCQIEDYNNFKLARPYKNNPILEHFSNLARELNVVLPISFFEVENNCYYNSLVVFDADGTDLGLYRKTHIPTGQCYEEKFYFTPGNTGFKVFETKFAKIGVGVCWDQWFPETARILAIKGAEILLYPTAIGSEPVLDKDSKDHWQNTMCGHAASNIMPLVASNRVGVERATNSSMNFFGSSFIASEDGNKVKEFNREDIGVLIHEFDLAKIREKRYSWGVFRDRRPEMYTDILKNS